MGTEYYLCDREKREVLYYGKSSQLEWNSDPTGVGLISAELIRATEVGNEERRMARAALWCEGRERVEVMADTALDAFPPWEESDGGKPFPRGVLRKGWTHWTADALRKRDGAALQFYLEDEGWKPFRLEGE